MSPDKFCAHLPDPGIPGRSDGTEAAAREIPVRVVELCVIEQIEELRSNQERCGLRNPGHFVESEIPVVESRTVEESPARITYSAQRFGSESGLVEIAVRSAIRTGVARVLENQAADEIGFIDTRRPGE